MSMNVKELMESLDRMNIEFIDYFDPELDQLTKAAVRQDWPFEELLFKAAALVGGRDVAKAGFDPGTRRTRSDGTYEKQNDGSWVRIEEPGADTSGGDFENTDMDEGAPDNVDDLEAMLEGGDMSDQEMEQTSEPAGFGDAEDDLPGEDQDDRFYDMAADIFSDHQDSFDDPSELDDFNEFIGNSSMEDLEAFSSGARDPVAEFQEGASSEEWNARLNSTMEQEGDLYDEEVDIVDDEDQDLATTISPESPYYGMGDEEAGQIAEYNGGIDEVEGILQSEGLDTSTMDSTQMVTIALERGLISDEVDEPLPGSEPTPDQLAGIRSPQEVVDQENFQTMLGQEPEYESNEQYQVSQQMGQAQGLDMNETELVAELQDAYNSWSRATTDDEEADAVGYVAGLMAAAQEKGLL